MTKTLCVLAGLLSPIVCINATDRQPPEQSGLPLQPTRTIAFTVNEGTWMSVDVSPDGRTIVFDLLGDLYTLPIAGGQASRVTSGMAFDAQPRFSPDGTRLVFTSDRDGWLNVWTAKRDGTDARQITHHHWVGNFGDQIESPVWTLDGQFIIVSERVDDREGGMRLAQYAASGDAAARASEPLTHRTPDEPKQELFGAAFGKDPNEVYAAYKKRDDSTYWQIAKIDRTTYKMTIVTSPLSGLSAMRPVLSRDGRYLVFSAPTGDATGLRIHDFTTDREWWLSRAAQRSVAPWFALDSRDLVPGSAFTPDGRALITSYDGQIWRLDVASGQATPIPFEAHVEQQAGPLTRFEYPIADEPFSARAIRHPQVSPDGTRVVFSAIDRVWIMDLPSGTPRRLTSDTVNPLVKYGATGEFFPTWSPDGGYVAYSTWSERDGGAIYRVRVTGASTNGPSTNGPSAPERLTRDALFYQKPTYTSDGTRIVAVRGFNEFLRMAGTMRFIAPDLAGLDLVSLPASGGPVMPIAAYTFSKEALFTAWKNQAFVYGQPHVSAAAAADRDRVFSYDVDAGLASTRLDSGDRTVLIAGFTHTVQGADEAKPFEALRSPDGRHVLLLVADSLQPYLVTLPERLPAPPPTIALAEGATNPPGVRVRRLSVTAADFIGWTRAGVPYYSIGNALFLAERAPDPSAADPPVFRRITIDLKVPRAKTPGTLLLRGARVLTMRGHEIIERGDVLIRDGRVAAVGAAGTIETPKGATVLDMSGKTILPGYVDVHDHLGYKVSWGTHLGQEPRLLVDLAYGITALRDAVGYGADLMAAGERSAAGQIIAPRIFTMSFIVPPRPFGDGSHQDLDLTRDVLKQWSEHRHSETIKQYMAGGRRTRQLVVMAAREQGLTATNEGDYNTAMDLTMALDGYPAFEHPMPATPQFDDVAQLIARSGLIQTPTLAVHFRFRYFLRRDDVWTNPKMRRFLPPGGLAEERRNITHFPYLFPDDDATIREVSAQPAKIVKAGGCVAAGSHGNVPGYDLHWELWLFSMGGMPNYDVLRTGTACAAEAIGHQKDFGTIAPGLLADLQILDENPLEDIHHTLSIRYVMKGGRLYEADTLDEVWPDKRPLDRQWWWPDPGSGSK
jgi:imidazolonepropionase-like amidohydrolase/Tol biopolymer transport system component